MYIDFLEKRWHRVEIRSAEDFDKVKKALKDGEINCSDDVFDVAKDASYELLADIGGTQVDADTEHEGWATIEAFEEDGEPIYANGRT